MHFIVAGSTMISKVLNSTCQRGDKCLPIPAIFHNTTLKGRCPRVHWYVRGYCVSSLSASKTTEGTGSRGFCFISIGWNTIKNSVWNTNTSLQTTAGIPAVPPITRETFQLHNRDWTTSVAVSLPVLTLASVSLCASLTFGYVLHPLPPPRLSEAQAEMVLPYSRGSLRTQWWTVFICCRTSWLAGRQCQLYEVFYQTGQALSHSMQIYDAHVWICGCEAGSVSSQSGS